MKPDEARNLGAYLQAKREALGYSTRKLASLAEMEQPTVVRIENGQFLRPGPEKLTKLAAALELSPTDLLTRAGYLASTDLPTLKPYLRTKYHELPEADVQKIEAYASRLARRHGVNLAGPAPGEDERP